MIEINELTVKYGELIAVDRLSLQIGKGEIFGLVGPNGAGKTSTLKALAGLLLPADGSVHVDGHDIVRERFAVQRRVGYMADFFGVYDHLTVSEYLTFFGAIYGMPEDLLRIRVEELADITRLEGKRQAYVKELSRGMKQRLYFARAVVHDPAILILDEPASGLDPRGRVEMMEFLRNMNRDGKTIVISSHILGELDELCTAAAFIETGRLVGHRAAASDAAAEGVRDVVLLVHESDMERACAFIEPREEVMRVEREGREIYITIRDEDDHVSRLVSDLVDEGVQIRLPRRRQSDLQEAFFRITKGETA